MDEDQKWARAAFCATSEMLTPSQMELLMGISPTRTHEIGDPVSSRSSTTRKDNYFSIQSSCSEYEEMEKHIEEIVSILEPKKDVIHQLSTKAKLCLFCGFSSGNGQGGFVLSPELLTRLNGLGLEFALDLYPPNTVDVK